MYEEKLINISDIMKTKNEIYFYLYNVLYSIKFSENRFEIKQSGIDLIYTYPSLKNYLIII